MLRKYGSDTLAKHGRTSFLMSSGIFPAFRLRVGVQDVPGFPGMTVPTVLPRLPVPSVHRPAFELLREGGARAQRRTSPTLSGCRKTSGCHQRLTEPKVKSGFLSPFQPQTDHRFQSVSAVIKEKMVSNLADRDQRATTKPSHQYTKLPTSHHLILLQS